MEERSTHETINKEDASLIYHQASSLRKRNRSDPPRKERKDEDRRRRRHIFLPVSIFLERLGSVLIFLLMILLLLFGISRQLQWVGINLGTSCHVTSIQQCLIKWISQKAIYLQNLSQVNFTFAWHVKHFNFYLSGKIKICKNLKSYTDRMG